MKLSSIRIKLSEIQLCNMLDILDALGGKTSSVRGSYASCLQKLVEHFIEMSLHQGLIHPVTFEEACARLNLELGDLDPEALMLEPMNLLPDETQDQIKEALEAQELVEKALIKEQAEENAGLTDLFK